LLSNLITIAALLLTCITSIGILISRLVIGLQIPGLEPATVLLGVRLSRLLFLLVLSQGLSAVLQSVLYARHSYILSTSGKAIGNIVTIPFIVFGGSKFGITAIAAGMLLGSAIQLSLLLIVLFKHGFRYSYILKPMAKVTEMMKAFKYTLSGHVLGESGTILQNVIGSFLGPGSITVMRYASRVVQALAGILLGSVVQVTLPLIASHAAVKDLRAQRKALLESIQLLAAVGVPICIWLVLTAQPLIVMLFERGEFSRANAVLTALIIQLMAPDLIMGRLVSVSQTIFYSNMDMRTPFVSTAIYTAANTIFAILLCRAVGVLGMPIAVSLASLSNMTYMMARLNSKFGPIGWSQLRGFALRLAATCLLGAAGHAIGSVLATLTPVSQPVAKVVDVAMPTALAMCTFIIGAFAFRLVNVRSWAPALGRSS